MAVEVVVGIVVDRRPNRNELAETRARSAASLSEALLLLRLLLQSRLLIEESMEIEGDGRPPPPLASEKKTILRFGSESIDLVAI